jgi:hypothetical protein
MRVRVTKRLFGVLFLALVLIRPSGAMTSFLNDECFPEIINPSYPAEALHQSLMGLVVAEFTVGDDGTPTQIAIKGYPLLTVGLGAFLHSIRLPPACLGNRVSLRIQYKIDREAKSGSPVVLNRLSASGYEVVAPGETIELAICDPDWVFSRRKRFFHKFHLVISHLRFW